MKIKKFLCGLLIMSMLLSMTGVLTAAGTTRTGRRSPKHPECPQRWPRVFLMRIISHFRTKA